MASPAQVVNDPTTGELEVVESRGLGSRLHRPHHPSEDEHRRLLAANGFALEDIRELPLDMAVLVARATV